MKATLSVIGAAAVVVTALVPILPGSSGSKSALAAGTTITKITSEYYPLKKGDVRNWQMTSPLALTGDFTQTVGDPTTVGGIEVFPLTTNDSGGNFIRVDFFGIDDQKRLRYAGYDVNSPGQQGSVRFNPPLQFPTESTVGQNHQQSASVEGTGSFAAVKSVTANISLALRETFEIPAGTLNDVAHFAVESTTRDADGDVLNQGTYNVYFAPGLGPVKVVTPLGFSNAVTSANVGGVAIP